MVAILLAMDLLSFPLDTPAGVAKLVYAPDSKSGEVKLMSVRVRPPAPHLYELFKDANTQFTNSLLKSKTVAEAFLMC